MDNDQFKNLLKRYELGECTEEELQFIEGWYNAESAIQSDKVSTEHLSRANANIWGKVMADTDLQEAIAVDEERTETRAFKLWPRIAGIAAAVIGIAICIWLYRPAVILNLFQDHTLAIKNDIAPGGNRATLSAANGNTINLSEKQSGLAVDATTLAYNDGTKIDPSSLGLNPSSRASARDLSLEVSVPRGGMYSIILQDGTKVWLNADSKLQFLSNYRNKLQRIVKLIKGEAYFEVAKDKAHPFIVECKGQSTEVLGTHFNISAYSDDVGIRTTLLEGSVRVRHLEGSAATRTEPFASSAQLNLLNSKNKRSLPTVRDDVVLKPGQQSFVTSSAGIKVKEVDASEAVAWKNGFFNFENENIKSVMRKVARWYNVEVIYEKGTENSRIGGIISRYENVSEVLDMINATKAVKCTIEGRKVTISK